jgi:predicted NAD/FAD-dependent oxidoreductase
MSGPLHDVVIVGAGLSGLVAGQWASRELSCVLLDKGRSVGGRLATRRLGGGLADHGAQFFTARDPLFAGNVTHWLSFGQIYEWSRGWSDGSLADAAPDGYPRYAATGGFNQWARSMAARHDVRRSTQVTAVNREGDGWRVVTNDGPAYSGRALLLTPPVPQSLALLDAGDVALPAADRAALEAVAYAPCLCGLFWIDGETDLPEPGAIQRPEADISWIADNQRKGISPGARVITVHGGPAASAARWDEDDASNLAWLTEGLRVFLRPGAIIRERELKRWRYALPTTLYPQRLLVAGTDAPLLFAGDAFGSPRVEGAWLSGTAAGQWLHEWGTAQRTDVAQSS